MQRTKERKREVVQSQREEERRSSARSAVRWGEERGEGGGGGGGEEAPVPRAPDRREVTPTELSDNDIIVVVDLPYPHRVIAACAFSCMRLRVEAPGSRRVDQVWSIDKFFTSVAALSARTS